MAWRYSGNVRRASSVLLATSIGVGVGVGVLLGASPGQPRHRPFQLTIQQRLALLAALTLVRGILQTQTALRQEELRSTFTDRLRYELLSLVLMVPSGALERLGRGHMLGLLMVDINRSVFALQQAVGLVQALLSLLAYAIGVIVVGRHAALPLLLAMLATAAAALFLRSESWRLGRLQSRLMGSLQRTVGDGLHGLKAFGPPPPKTGCCSASPTTAAAGARWCSRTCGANPCMGPCAMRWWCPRASCLGMLPGYQELSQAPGPQPQIKRRPRRQCQPAGHSPAGVGSLRRLGQPALARASGSAADQGFATPELDLRPGSLLAVVGPSGSGKTTLLDRFCGWLADDQSQWQIHLNAGGSPVELAGAEGARQLRQLLAYAPQDAVLFEATLCHNLLLGRRPSSAPVEPWLERVGLAHLLQRSGGIDDPLPLALDQLSGGEIHRLGLVRAWLRDRPVEVFDEPTAFLDAESAQRVRAILKERSRERLVLVSTYDPALIQLAERVITLKTSDHKGAELQYHDPGLP